jgi:hypothetical protein
VQPIAPTWRKEPVDDPDWLFDVKYDGFRALYYIEPGHNRLISRNGNVLTRFDALGGALAAELDVGDAIIDGEMIDGDETGRPQFYDLLRSTRAPAYVAFDIVWLNGADLRSRPLDERRRALQMILPKGSPIVSEDPRPPRPRCRRNSNLGDMDRYRGLLLQTASGGPSRGLTPVHLLVRSRLRGKQHRPALLHLPRLHQHRSSQPRLQRLAVPRK